MMHFAEITDNDTDDLDWTVTSSYLPLVAVAPPREQRDLTPFVAADNLEGFQLVYEKRMIEIDNEIYDTLLEQGLEEYEEIWRSLARK